jgi:hypothetical protein
MEDEYTQKSADEYESVEFNNYTFYKIVPKNKELNYNYVGQTTNFINRKLQHRKQVENETYDKSHYKLYKTIRQNGGWNEWEMIEIEKLNGKTRLEARMREQELIKENKSNLNILNAYITEEERSSTKKAITEKYRENNKELLKEQTKQYKEHHKDIIAEQMKKYRAENKEKIREKTKEYIENNKEKHDETQKAWREKNKEISKEKRKLKTAELKAEKLEQQSLLEQTPEWQEKQKQIAEEKEAIKKEKRDKFNEERRLKRLQDKEQKEAII